MQFSEIIFLVLLVLSCYFSGCSSDDHRSFSQSEITYFKEIALKSEYINAESKIIKWSNKTVTINISGDPNEKSLDCLNLVIVDFNKISKTTQLKIEKNENADIDIYFGPDSEFLMIDPNYVPNNRGYFSYEYNTTDCTIQKSQILISTESDLTDDQRCHLIREELTQSLGLFDDSLKYPNSIFYQGWTDTTHYAEIDKTLIKMLYNTDVKFCGTPDEVEDYFNGAT
jgi:hypothetical protein